MRWPSIWPPRSSSRSLAHSSPWSGITRTLPGMQLLSFSYCERVLTSRTRVSRSRWKVEFGEETTRVHVTARNNTRNNASFFTHNARIVQGSRQIDPERSPQYDLPNPNPISAPALSREGS